ncbi:hypothetical protein [Hansschlegelia zhihuaiae]|nr:hypothetical protein [Hansschlegelia zhihuaiae]
MDDIETTNARKAREAAERERKAQEELHDAFMKRELPPDIVERVSTRVRWAAERGEKELLVMRFPSSFCTDQGRAINNADPKWPQTLEGFAKRAYEFYESELKPNGFGLQVEIVDFPRGMPGDVGFTLVW